jgi:hypothetical protein
LNLPKVCQVLFADVVHDHAQAFARGRHVRTVQARDEDLQVDDIDVAVAVIVKLNGSIPSPFLQRRLVPRDAE